jgi:hypothetical protein
MLFLGIAGLPARGSGVDEEGIAKDDDDRRDDHQDHVLAVGHKTSPAGR